jgi:hypothetical protein
MAGKLAGGPLYVRHYFERSRHRCEDNVNLVLKRNTEIREIFGLAERL